MSENCESSSRSHQPSMQITPVVESHELTRWKDYDVFLSFRGVDTRFGIVSHLYHELNEVRGIKTFKDDRDLEIGDPVRVTLLKAIEDSHFAIVILSENYAQSGWCLDKLTKICGTLPEKNILPLFHHVQPTDVRHQTGSYETALEEHTRSQHHNAEKMKQWKEALEKVAGFSGCVSKGYSTEREVVEWIANSVCDKIQKMENCHNISSFEWFEATKEAGEKVMNALTNKDVFSIGVSAMPGIGKTTLVKHVAEEVKSKKLFHLVAMVVVSQNPNLWEIQKILASALVMKLEGENVDDRAKNLKRKIMGRNCLLIILDNICSNIQLSNIGIPSFEELTNRNSKVLVTTQEPDVFSRCQEKITMETLSELDSWMLFDKHATTSADPKLYTVAREVANYCAGLPIALKTVAKALKGKSKKQWKEAARQLQKSNNILTKESADVYKCINLCYANLRDMEYKKCFLLCCLFPQDYDIKTEDLLKYRVGEDLVSEYQIKEAGDSICSAVQSLKDSYLLLDGQDNQCARMHDVIRKVGQEILRSEDGYRKFFVKAGCELQKWPMISAHKYYTAISLVKNKISDFPEELVFPQLQILLLQSSFEPPLLSAEIPVCSFQSLEGLRVLDISKNLISFPPASPTFLTSLHTLCLDGCTSIGTDMSFLKQLKQLTILSMRDYPNSDLPREVGQLTKLRLLDFTSNSIGIVPSGVIGILKNLEELYMQCYFADWESSVEGSIVVRGKETNASFEELIGLPLLQKLKVFISDVNRMPQSVSSDLTIKWKNFDICIHKDDHVRMGHLNSTSSCVYSRVLTLDISMRSIPKWFVDFVVKKSRKLQFLRCLELRNILLEYDSGRLHELKCLSVSEAGQVKELMSVTGTRDEPVFKNLEELHLDQLDSLEKLCVGELPPESLINLRLLKVSNCHKLMNAVESNLLQRLQKLEILSCENMDGLKYVFSYERSGLEQTTLPQLKEMRLVDLLNLTKIWNGPTSCNIFYHVKILVILRCHELKNLFTYDEAGHLLNLEDLSIEVCRNLERVIEASEETVRNKIVLPKLKKIALKELPRLARFYGSTGNAITEDEENIEFPLLELSAVDRCPNFLSPTWKKLNSKMGEQPRSNSFGRETSQSDSYQPEIQVEQVVCGFDALHLNPGETENANIFLKDHEQALIDENTMIENASDGEIDKRTGSQRQPMDLELGGRKRHYDEMPKDQADGGSNGTKIMRR